ncbi:MAG: hypothetical protein Q4Q58_06235 [Thermoplasmata archaeon]|nr:hypothetical protein [Thermoplasmata archaeon]
MPMKILGSSKVDDYRKVVLGEKVVKTLNLKQGDSVLFYKKDGGSDVRMFRAEGTNLTEEFDSRPHIHLRGLRSYLFMLSGITLILAIIATVLFHAEDSGSSIGVPSAAVYVLLALIAVLAIGSIFTARSMDTREDDTMIVSIGGPYTKDRLLGLSRLMSDGKIVTGNLYINSLFGANPVTVEVSLDFDDGFKAFALTKCTKNVPGYSVHKIRVPSEGIGNGSMTLDLTYVYNDKAIHVLAKYRIFAEADSMIIRVEEDGVTATVEFDESFQRSVFDESLFDPSDDDVTL